MQKKIFFFHIEKCGGTTFHHLLRYNYPTYFSLTPKYSSGSDLTGGIITEKEIRRLFSILPFTKGVGGHTLRPYINYGSAIGKDVFRMTFLREPMNRFLSHLNYLGLHLYGDKNFEKYMEINKYENFMTKRLAGKEDIKLAKEILMDRFEFVGIVEMFDESLLILKRKLEENGFSPFYKKKNVSQRNKHYKKMENIDKDLLQKIRDKNVLDIELYKFAVEKIYGKLAHEYGPALAQDVEKFQKAKADYRFDYVRYKTAFVYRVLCYYLQKVLKI